MSKRILIVLTLAAAIQAGYALLSTLAVTAVRQDYAVPLDTAMWIVTAYLGATASVAPFVGRLRDLFGMRPTLNVSMGIFGLASLGCLFVETFSGLIIMRLVQGLAAGVIHPMAHGLLIELSSEAQRPKSIGFFGSGVLIGSLVGASLGGYLIEALGWRLSLAAGFPLAVITIVLLSAVPYTKVSLNAAKTFPWGQTIFVFFVWVLIVAVSNSLEPGTYRSLSQGIVFAFALGVVSLISIVKLRSAIFSSLGYLNRIFVVSTTSLFIAGACLTTLLAMVPAMAQEAFQVSTSLTGLLTAPRALVMSFALAYAGRLAARHNPSLIVFAGWLVSATAFGILAISSEETIILSILAGTCLHALGSGLLFTPLNVLAFSKIDQASIMDASGMYNFVRQLSFMVGLTVFSAVLTVLPGSSLTGSLEVPNYGALFLMLAVLSCMMAPSIHLFSMLGHPHTNTKTPMKKKGPSK